MTRPFRSDSSAGCGPAGGPSLAFEITRGQTASPLRPLLRHRFLIGAGPACDLRLGGTGMPTIHSVVHCDGPDVWIESLLPLPGLHVNGRLTRSAVLTPGDEVAIGPFRLTLRQTEASPAPSRESGSRRTPDGNWPLDGKPVPSSPVELDADGLPDDEGSDEGLDAACLSACELVDLIAAEQALIDEFDLRREQGAQALLDAVRQLRSGTVEVEETQPTAGSAGRPGVAAAGSSLDRSVELVYELQTAVAALQKLASDLEHRAERLTAREAERTAASLFDFQRQVVSRLDGVLARIVALREQQAEPPRRRDVA